MLGGPPGPTSEQMPMQQMTGARSRLRFESIAHRSGHDGRCRVSVRLEWEGQSHERACESLETFQGRLDAAARATLAGVVAAAIGDRADLQLVGIKAVRAFDGWVVVARINGKDPGRSYRLLGSAPCEGEDELPRTAARAVLNALNRVVESYVP